jgi:hypothetical protein
MALKIDAFLSTPPCDSSAKLIRLLDEVRRDYGEAVEIIMHDDRTDLFDAYSLTATPAVVVEELVKMVGFCPSKESLIAALREMGLE